MELTRGIKQEKVQISVLSLCDRFNKLVIWARSAETVHAEGTT